MVRRWVEIVAAALLAALAAGCGGEGNRPKRIRLSLILGENSEWYQGAMKWKELVEARTGGRYRVEVIPNAARSNNSQGTELQDVQGGRLEASLESTILLSTIDDCWAVFSFPWLFANHKAANAVCDGPVGQAMLAALAERNLVGLAYGANGFRQITNNQRPIRTPDDLKGLKIRIPQGLPPVLLEHFGASAHHMNFGDLVVALRTGDMHGQENPLSVIQNSKLPSIQKYLTIWNYVYDPIVLCVNKDFWLKLPEADRNVLRECAREALAHERSLVAQADEELPAKLQAAGMDVARLSDAELDAFKAKRETLRPYFEKLVGKLLLSGFEIASTAAEGRP
jgi:tripartite ATP-independent transporter DctP family solute receptor